MVEEDLRAFNVERLYAVDTAVTPIVVAEAARTLPMIAPRRVVIVLQAEKLFDPKKKRKAAEPAPDEDESAGRSSRWSTTSPTPSPTTALAFVFSIPEGGKGADRHPAGEEPEGHQGAGEGRDAGRVHGSRRRQGSGPLDRAAGRRPPAWRSTARSSPRIVQLSGGDAGRLRADVEKLLLFAAGRRRS